MEKGETPITAFFPIVQRCNNGDDDNHVIVINDDVQHFSNSPPPPSSLSYASTPPTTSYSRERKSVGDLVIQRSNNANVGDDDDEVIVINDNNNVPSSSIASTSPSPSSSSRKRKRIENDDEESNEYLTIPDQGESKKELVAVNVHMEKSDVNGNVQTMIGFIRENKKDQTYIVLKSPFIFQELIQPDEIRLNPKSTVQEWCDFMNNTYNGAVVCEEKRFSCPYCKFFINVSVTGSLADLRSHMLRCHFDVEGELSKYTCPKCNCPANSKNQFHPQYCRKTNWKSAMYGKCVQKCPSNVRRGQKWEWNNSVVVLSDLRRIHPVQQRSIKDYNNVAVIDNNNVPSSSIASTSPSPSSSSRKRKRIADNVDDDIMFLNTKRPSNHPSTTSTEYSDRFLLWSTKENFCEAATLEEMADNGWMVVRVTDGCAFKAASLQLYGSEHKHLEIRKAVADEIDKDRSYWSTDIELRKMTVDEYIKVVLNPQISASDVSLAAMADALKCKLMLYENGKGPKFCNHSFNTNIIRLVSHGVINQFDLLVPAPVVYENIFKQNESDVSSSFDVVQTMIGNTKQCKENQTFIVLKSPFKFEELVNPEEINIHTKCTIQEWCDFMNRTYNGVVVCEMKKFFCPYCKYYVDLCRESSGLGTLKRHMLNMHFDAEGILLQSRCPECNCPARHIKYDQYHTGYCRKTDWKSVMVGKYVQDCPANIRKGDKWNWRDGIAVLNCNKAKIVYPSSSRRMKNVSNNAKNTDVNGNVQTMIGKLQKCKTDLTFVVLESPYKFEELIKPEKISIDPLCNVQEWCDFMNNTYNGAVVCEEKRFWCPYCKFFVDLCAAHHLRDLQRHMLNMHFDAEGILLQSRCPECNCPARHIKYDQYHTGYCRKTDWKSVMNGKSVQQCPVNICRGQKWECINGIVVLNDTDSIPISTARMQGLRAEIEYEYAVQTEAWKWFHESLDDESQKWRPSHLPHDCYAFFAEKDLQQIQETLKQKDLSDKEVYQFIRNFMKYIGETNDFHTRTRAHKRESKFKDEMVDDNWVMVSLNPQLHFNMGKGKDMEAVMLMLAKHFGLYNTRTINGYGLYNYRPGRSSTSFYADILADKSHEHHQKLLDVFKDSILWGIKYGKKLYISKIVNDVSDVEIEDQAEDDGETHDKRLQRMSRNNQKHAKQRSIYRAEYYKKNYKKLTELKLDYYLRNRDQISANSKKNEIRAKRKRLRRLRIKGISTKQRKYLKYPR